MKPQKRTYKTLRGPRGPRGEQGLSAYGVWLQAGNQGTIQDYLRAMQCARECLWMHNGGQVVAPGQSIQMQRVCGRLHSGLYVVHITMVAKQCTVAIFMDGTEQNNTRFYCQGMMQVATTIRIFSTQAQIEVRNVGKEEIRMGKGDGVVDTCILFRPID